MTVYPAALCVLLLCGPPSLPDDTVPCPPPVSAPMALGAAKAALPALEGPVEVAPSPSPFPSKQGASEPLTSEMGTDSRRWTLGPLAACGGSSNRADGHEHAHDSEVSSTVESDPVHAPESGATAPEPSEEERTDSGVEEAEATSVPVDMGSPEDVEVSEEAGSSTGGNGPAEPEMPSDEVPETQEDVVSSVTRTVENNEENNMVGQATPETAQATTVRTEDRADSHPLGKRPVSDAEERPPSKKVEESSAPDPVGHFTFAEASTGGALERVVGATSTTLLILLGFGTLALRLSLGWPRFPPLYLGRRRLGSDSTDQ